MSAFFNFSPKFISYEMLFESSLNFPEKNVDQSLKYFCSSRFIVQFDVARMVRQDSSETGVKRTCLVKMSLKGLLLTTLAVGTSVCRTGEQTSLPSTYIQAFDWVRPKKNTWVSES